MALLRPLLFVTSRLKHYTILQGQTNVTTTVHEQYNILSNYSTAKTIRMLDKITFSVICLIWKSHSLDF